MEAKGRLRVTCQIHTDRNTSCKNESWKKKVFMWIKPFFKPGASVVDFMGNHRAVGAAMPTLSAWTPSPESLIKPAEGKSPSTGLVLCRMQSITDPPLALDPLAFQLLLEKASHSHCPLLPSPSLALSVRPSTRRTRVCKACQHQEWQLEPRLSGTAVGGRTPPPPILQEPGRVSRPHRSPTERTGVLVLPQGRRSLGPCEHGPPAQS